MHPFRAGIVPFCLCLASFAPVHADVVQLIDGTKMNAKLVHYYDGAFTFDVAGKTVKVPQSKVRSISFEAREPRPEFATPEKTFKRWLAAVKDKDLAALVDCYALMFQGMATRQFESMSQKDRDAMWEQMAQTKLKWTFVDIKGDQAVATIEAKRDKEEATGHVNFVKEGGEWKMAPGQMLGGGEPK